MWRWRFYGCFLASQAKAGRARAWGDLNEKRHSLYTPVPLSLFSHPKHELPDLGPCRLVVLGQGALWGWGWGVRGGKGVSENGRPTRPRARGPWVRSSGAPPLLLSPSLPPPPSLLSHLVPRVHPVRPHRHHRRRRPQLPLPPAATPLLAPSPLARPPTDLHYARVMHVRHDRNLVAQLADGALGSNVHPARGRRAQTGQRRSMSSSRVRALALSFGGGGRGRSSRHAAGCQPA